MAIRVHDNKQWCGSTKAQMQHGKQSTKKTPNDTYISVSLFELVEQDDLVGPPPDGLRQHSTCINNMSTIFSQRNYACMYQLLYIQTNKAYLRHSPHIQEARR